MAGILADKDVDTPELNKWPILQTWNNFNPSMDK